jgi:hypothetical protein
VARAWKRDRVHRPNHLETLLDRFRIDHIGQLASQSLENPAIRSAPGQSQRTVPVDLNPAHSRKRALISWDAHEIGRSPHRSH